MQSMCCDTTNDDPGLMKYEHSSRVCQVSAAQQIGRQSTVKVSCPGLDWFWFILVFGVVCGVKATSLAKPLQDAYYDNIYYSHETVLLRKIVAVQTSLSAANASGRGVLNTLGPAGSAC